MRPQARLLRQAGVRVATAATTLNVEEPNYYRSNFIRHAHDVGGLLLAVEVGHGQTGQLRDAHTSVDEEAQQRGVPPVLEGVALAGIESRRSYFAPKRPRGVG